MKPGRGILFTALFLWSTAGQAENFYEREAQSQKASWEFPTDAEDLLDAFYALKTDVVETSVAYRIVINLPARKLFVYNDRSEMIKTYPVAVGANRYRTPIGPRYLSNITWNPWWYPPPDSEWAKGAKPTPPGAGNPLGKVKMSLGGDIFLHATNKEYTVGSAASHGCMRMYNKDAVELAWFFQTQFSDQTDEALRAKYEAHRGDSFFVPLKEKIPVDVIYETVVVKNSEIVIHPDIYGRERNLEDKVLGELADVGIPAWDIDPIKLQELKRLPNSASIRIEDLLGQGMPLTSSAL